MQKRNEHIRRTEILVEEIIKNPMLHIKWLNTLSYLEHMGSKKIHKANLGPYLNESVLSHACEEARHAYFYKKSIRKIDPNIPEDFNYSYGNLIAGFSSFKYFQQLDLKVLKYFQDKQKNFNKNFLALLCYLYVTYLIEERADMVFNIYQERLKKMQIPINITSVIKEEEKHLKKIFDMIQKFDQNYDQHLMELSNLETDLFDWYLNRLERVVFRSSEGLAMAH